MKTKLLKIAILVLLILFNALSVFAYMHIKDKIDLKHDINNFDYINDFKINESLVYPNNHFAKLVLVDYKKNVYDLVKDFDDIHSLINLFNTNNLIKYNNEFKMSESKLFIDDKVMNYNDQYGFFYSDGILNRIEIYDFDNLIGSKLKLYDYDSIMKVIGKGNIFKTCTDTYDYYLLCYKHEDVYMQFVSFYEDGRNCICILSKSIIM